MDEPNDPNLSRKEFARQVRRAAYLRAKEFRATDPKQLAFKEAMKQRSREATQAHKERKKAAAKDQKARRSELDASQQAARDRQLMMLVKPATRSE